MSILEQLSDEACWERFYDYKTSLACPKTFAKELRQFIDARGWEPVCEEIRGVIDARGWEPVCEEIRGVAIRK